MTEEVKNLEFMAAYIDGDILYAAGMALNILFQYDLNTKKLYRLGVFKGFKNPNAVKICKMFKYKEHLYCFSNYSYEVAAYHMDKKEFMYYCPENKTDENVDIRCVCRVNNNVWLFREAIASSVMVFSMENQQYTEHKLDTSVLKGYDVSLTVCCETCVLLDSQIWRCLPGHNVLLAYDVESFKVKLVKMDWNISAYTISYAYNRFFILGRDGKQVVVWNSNTNKIVVWETGYKGVEDRAFRKIICKGKKIFLIPCLEDEIYCYEIIEEKLCFKKKIKYPLEFRRLHYNGCLAQSMFMEDILKNTKLYLFPFGGNGMLCMEMENLKVEFYPVQISEEDYIEGNIESKLLLRDSQICLTNYMKAITLNVSKYGMENNLLGRKCWERLKSV